MEVLVNKVLDNNKSIFLKDIGKILAVQIIFQICLSALFYLYPPYFEISPVQYFNYSAYFFIFVICTTTLKYSLANRVLIYLFVFEFFYLAIFQIIPIYVYILYNLQIILNAAIPLLITIYLFFYSIAPNNKKQKKPLVFTVALILIIVLVTYSNVDFFTDYSNIDEDMRNIILNNLLLDSYYVNLINLSFLLFVWFTYNQGQYLLSEYLPAILSVHTLLIINEVYQLYNYNHLMYEFIDGQYFNAIINIGFIIIWFIRLNYLSDPESKKGEYFVNNYDMLSGYVEKPPNELWDAILTKLGKQKLLFGSLILFGIICVPLILIGDINFFSRFNIILMLFFLVAVMIYAIIYTQRKWFNHIGFLIKEQKK